MKLIALGDNVIDEYRNTGESFPGGNAVNVAVHASRLGADAEYLGAFATDKYADIVREALKQNDVTYAHCTTLSDTTTKRCCYHVVDGERSFLEVITGPAWVGPVQLTEKQLQVLSKADVIVSSCNAKMPEQLAKVQSLPAVFVYDFGEKEKYRTEEYYEQVCHQMDLAMFSCSDMKEAEFEALCEPLHRRGVVYVLATMGARGQCLSIQGKIVKSCSQMVQASDTMGAGDSFLAAFVCSLMDDGWKKGTVMSENVLRRALEKAQIVAAGNCMTQGGFGVHAETLFI